MYRPTVMPGGATYGQPAPPVPQTGLIGREAALSGGLRGSLEALGRGGNANYRPINANRDLAMQQAQQGIQSLDGYAQPGMQAQQSQAALSGAMGNEAQAQAYQNFQSSPGQQWLQEQAERGLTRSAAAIGGLGGGNVRQALQRQSMGLAQQDFQNSFNRMGNVADRGLQAAGQQTNLRGVAANAATAAGGQYAGLHGQALGNQASLARDAGNYAFQTGMATAEGRTNAGNAIANQQQGTTSALASLINQQGSGLADITGVGAGNLANLLAGAGRDQFASDSGRAALLANLATGAASNIAGLGGIPGTSEHVGLMSRVGTSGSDLGNGIQDMAGGMMSF